jgi:SpoVK/Ycf46/Vps4 family AAA+-type ATPase
MDRILSLLLVEIDGALTEQPGANGSRRGGMVILGTTHDLSLVEPALLRPGRLDQHMELNLPNAVGRADILAKLLADIPLECDEEEGRAAVLATLNHSTSGYSGAELERLCQEAAVACLRRALDHPGDGPDGSINKDSKSAAAIAPSLSANDFREALATGKRGNLSTHACDSSASAARLTPPSEPFRYQPWTPSSTNP